MTHSTPISLSRRALQLTTLFLAFAPVTFGDEPVTTSREGQLIGQMLVTAPREHPLIGHIVVTARRMAPASMVFADLGAMTVTAQRENTFARENTRHAELRSF